MDLNARARTLCQHAVEHADTLRLGTTEVAGARVIDFGIDALGGIEAGRLLARICLCDLAEVRCAATAGSGISDVSVEVHTDFPLLACMGGQYAGWPVQTGDYFAMGSGPMRTKRGREPLLEELGLVGKGRGSVVGVLETESVPSPEVVRYVADECGVTPNEVILCVAPVTSLAGGIQVVARAVETAMHKVHALGMDLGNVVSAFGAAPLPPPATAAVAGIGRTNDAILYGGRVTLWVDAEPDQIEEIGPRVPSGASSDYGRPFVEVFKSYGYDFYKVDANLFSPAVVTFVNLRNGQSRSFGQTSTAILRRSFGVSPAAGEEASE